MNHSAALNKARAAIKKNGAPMVLRSVTRGSVFDVTTDQYEETTTETPFYGLKRGPNAAERQSGLIQSGDMIILAPGDISPNTGDIITDMKGSWRVEVNEGLEPGTVLILNRIHVRKVAQ